VRSRRIGRGWEKARVKGTKRRAALEAFAAAERREGASGRNARAGNKALRSGFASRSFARFRRLVVGWLLAASSTLCLCLLLGSNRLQIRVFWTGRRCQG
jgi:hypothetical protein